MRIRPKSLSALAILTTLTSLTTAQTLTITHVNLIDVTDGNVRVDITVTVDGNRVVGVGPSTASNPNRGPVGEGSGKYLIPVLWVMHPHMFSHSPAADGTGLVLPLSLANGITGVRDMG